VSTFRYHPSTGRAARSSDEETKLMTDDKGGADLSGERSDQYRLLSVIVPVFNERSTVAEVIRRIRAVELPFDVEVIVVDDGSSDGTDKVLQALGDSTIRVIDHQVNLGKAAAIRTGMQAIRGDLVLVQDADLEYDPNDWARPKWSTAAASRASAKTCCHSTGSATASCRW
jgi:cellulose synthase/poly-beta-1,6-N-acetylglucosamine synthase-like glycosyltransferase